MAPRSEPRQLKRRSWEISVSNETGEKWPNPDSKQPRHPVRVVPLDDAESLAVALASISDLRKTWPSAARALDEYRSHHPRETTDA